MFATAICYITESKCSSSQWLWLELISMIQDIFQVLERVKESHVVLASDPDHFLYLNVFTKHTQSTVLAHRGLSVLTCWSPTREQGEWTLSKASSESTCAFGRLFHRFVIFRFGFFSPTKINSFQLHRMIKKGYFAHHDRFSLFQAGLKFLPGIRMKTVQAACSGAVSVQLGRVGMLAMFFLFAPTDSNYLIWRLYHS